MIQCSRHGKLWFPPDAQQRGSARATAPLAEAIISRQAARKKPFSQNRRIFLRQYHTQSLCGIALTVSRETVPAKRHTACPKSRFLPKTVSRETIFGRKSFKIRRKGVHRHAVIHRTARHLQQIGQHSSPALISKKGNFHPVFRKNLPRFLI